MLSNSVNQEAEPHSTWEEQNTVLLFKTGLHKVINNGRLYEWLDFFMLFYVFKGQEGIQPFKAVKNDVRIFNDM